MGDDLRDFQSESEVGRSSFFPVCDRRRFGRAVKRAVNFDGTEIAGIKVQIIARVHTARVERAIPAFRSKGRGSEKKARDVGAPRRL